MVKVAFVVEVTGRGCGWATVVLFLGHGGFAALFLGFGGFVALFLATLVVIK